jgi:hypothetical protein
MILSKNRWDSETCFALLEGNYRQAFVPTTGIQVESSFIRELQSNRPLTFIKERIGGFEIEGLDAEAVETCHQALGKKLSPSYYTAEEKVRVEKRPFQVLKMHGVHSLQMDIKLKFVNLVMAFAYRLTWFCSRCQVAVSVDFTKDGFIKVSGSETNITEAVEAVKECAKDVVHRTLRVQRIGERIW